MFKPGDRGVVCNPDKYSSQHGIKIGTPGKVIDVEDLKFFQVLFDNYHFDLVYEKEVETEVFNSYELVLEQIWNSSLHQAMKEE